MIKAVGQSVLILAIAAIVLSASLGRVAAQQTDLPWLVITFKLQIVEGRRLIQVMGPFPSAATCEATLKIAQDGLSRQGLEVASSACRTDVTVVVPE